MTVRFSKPFKREYAKLSAPIRKKVDRQIRQLTQDIHHPSLSARKMVNEQAIWEARVDIHYRMTFQLQRDLLTLRRIGTHEIYRNP